MGLPEPRTRADVTRALAVNAATKPANVAVGAGVAVAGLLLGMSWLLVVAAVVYVVLSVLTFFDSDEAERVGENLRGGGSRPERTAVRLGAAVAARLAAARREEAAIRVAISESDLALDDLTGEVDGLMRGLETIARRAQRLLDYRDSQDRRAIRARLDDARQAGDASHAALAEALAQQLDTLDRTDRQLASFEAEMDHAAATLSVMRGQLVQLSISTDAMGEERLAEQARALRERVTATSAAMAELAEEV